MLRFFFVAIMIYTHAIAQNIKIEQIDIKEKKIKLLKQIEKSFITEDTKKLFTLYKKLAQLYKKNGEYYKAVEYYKLALKLFLTTKKDNTDAKTEVILYKNLAFCYKKIGNNFKTFKYTYKAVQLANKIYGKNSKIAKKLDKEVAEIQSRMIAASI